MDTFRFLLFLYISATFSNGQTFLTVKGNNITLNEEKVFLSGVNQAWYAYGEDFGRNYYVKSKPHLVKTLDSIHANGGNSIRIWLHISGSQTPLFNSSGYVTGLDPNITHDMRDFIREAQKRNILVNFCLWNGAVMQTSFPVYGLIMDEDKLQSYITHALIPMVRALKTERGLGIWEIINEPEGSIKAEVRDTSEPCYDTSTLHWDDFADFTHARIRAQHLLSFIARQASAIHTEDPKALVTVGSWTYKSVTDQLGRRNLYSDQCLYYASGGLAGSRLDLYQIHTYDTLFFYLPHDPFMVNGTIYNFNKPVIIGEFSQKKGGLMTSPEQFTWAYYYSYNGAWSWSAINSDDASDPLSVQEKGMLSLKGKNNQTYGGRVNIRIHDRNMFSDWISFIFKWIAFIFGLFYLPFLKFI